MEVDIVNSTFSLKLGDAEINESHVRIDGFDSVIRPDKHIKACSCLFLHLLHKIQHRHEHYRLQNVLERSAILPDAGLRPLAQVPD